MTRFKLAMALGMFVALVSFAASAQATACGDRISTVQGPVTGVADASLPVCAYKGIPYAAAPVGDLRWKPPQPPATHQGVLPAREFGFRCISSGAGSGAPKSMLPEMGEDCLNLNVWRPAKSGSFPVMVWIHGGSLSVGTAAEPLYKGERLSAREDVVVVSINYRLNYYGFLALPGLSAEDPNGSSGNYGLLDQVAALQWVKDNIENFGGDPSNVTIFGESAGGWSVCNLLGCPLAAGLFERAIIESGGCDVVKSLEEGYRDGDKLAQNAGCGADDAVSCLRSKSPEQIALALKASARKKPRGKKKGSLLTSMMKFEWIPHVDGWALKEAPLEALRSGEFNHVPLMVGTNRDEVKLFTITIPGIRLAPKSLVRTFLKTEMGDDEAKRLEELYPFNEYKRPADAAIDAFGDMGLGCRCFEGAEAASGYEPVYYYRFDYDRHLLPDLVGAAHGLEIPFVFGNFDVPPATWFLAKSQEKQAQVLSDQVMKYWANFARQGNPNGPGLLEWPAYDSGKRLRMIFDENPYVEPADNVEKCRFWRELNISMY